MSGYPFLSLSRVSVDPVLARQLPKRLAYFHLALPLAYDDGQLTVVMAHPDNPTAVTMLQTVLGKQIVPVRGSANEIRATLNLIWSDEGDPDVVRILSWGATEPQSALAFSVANLIAEMLSAQTLCLDASQSSLETVLTLAREGRYSLSVIDAPQDETLSHLLRESATPVLLVHGAQLKLQHILLVLRGHSPDESVLDWVVPLAKANEAAVTLLTVAPTAGSRRMPHGLAALLTPDSGPGEHITTCAQRLTEAGIKGYLKLRQGTSEQQIAEEVAQGQYDLITIAAEAHGDFVHRVLRQIETSSAPVLVIKPVLSDSLSEGR
jgi:nucleotide-binding universal stress UspA family protein